MVFNGHVHTKRGILQDNPNFGLQQALVTTVQLVIENNPGASKLKIAEAGGNNSAELIYANKLIDIVESEPTFSVSFYSSVCRYTGFRRLTNVIFVFQVDYTVASTVAGVAEAVEEAGGKVVAKDASAGPIEKDNHLAVATNAAYNETILVNLAASVKAGGFVLSIEDSQVKETIANKVGLTQIFKLPAEGKTVYLFRKVSNFPKKFSTVMTINFNKKIMKFQGRRITDLSSHLCLC